MKAIYFIGLILLFNYVRASSYYFSDISGDDSRSVIQAQNLTTPWKTIEKLNSLTIIKPGDSILFKKNEFFYGTILVNASGTINNEIVYSSYGNGNNPVLTGMKPVNKWTYFTENIYYSALDASLVNLVTVDGQIKAMGRYPNKGYMTYENHVDNTSISDLELSELPDWTGAEVVIKKNRWIIDRHTVISHSKRTIFYSTSTSYGNNGIYSPVNNNGYFIQGHLSTLDQRGEWFLDAKAKRFYMYFGSKKPQNIVVQVSCVDRNATINTNNHIIFNQLTFEGANTKGVYLTGTDNIKFIDCSFRKQGGDAIYGIDVSSILIKGGVVQDALNNGICMESKGDQVVIDSVLIRNAGVIPGAGRSGDGNQQGIIINGSGTQIRHSAIIHTGYNGINFTGSNVVIQNNLVDTFCTVKDDGGGIYTYTGLDDKTNYTNRVLKGNIVLNGLGTGEGTSERTTVHAHGIYIDDNSRNVEISDNTIAHCAESGIFIHDSKNIRIIRNTAFNNRSALLMTQDVELPGLLVRNNVVKNNLFFSKDRVDRVAHFTSTNSDIQQFGVFDKNFYCRPLDQHFIISEYVSNARKSFINGYDLSGWQSRYGQDPDSKIAPGTIKPYHIKRLTSPNIFGNIAFNNDIRGVGNWSPSNSCQTGWIKSSGLDAGALQVMFSPSSTTGEISQVILDIGAINPSKNYVLRFSLLGTKKNKSIQAYLRKKESPYQDVSNRMFCKLSTTRTENEVVFSTDALEKDVFLVFEVNSKDSTFWIDNVNVSKGEVKMTDPDDYIRFEYNADTREKSVYLGNAFYVDMVNQRYTGSFTLRPFSSIILLKVQEDNVAITRSGLLQLDGVRDRNYHRLTCKTELEPDSAIFRVLRSCNGIDFSTLCTQDFRTRFNREGTYSFVDSNPLPGKNFYKITGVDTEGLIISSETILLEYMKQKSLPVYPNPVKELVYISCPVEMYGRTLRLRVVKASGVETVSSKFVAKSNYVSLNTSALSSGIYYLELSCESSVYYSTFFKQ